ncbi:MAG: EF-P lysine aminoacylase GenX, partial [Oligoflexia bacterium]|nr:EF-P lysine aminoacylase GenX [Oligoflexia bacterium]
PELELKRLLALGFPAIFQVGHVFRQGDWSDLHEPEFTMAEWYRVGFDAAQLAAETVAICTELADLPPVSQRTVAGLCRELAGIEVLDLQAGFELSRALGGTEEPFVHAFSRLWVERVEPALAQQGAVLVTRWPVALGMLARRAPDDPRVAERFELVVRGVELANGFAELTDPVEQRARFQQDRAQRRSEGLCDAPTPERFLRALEAGLPPCAGVAVGVDRLAMIATDGTCLADLLASPLRDRLDCPRV